MSAAFPTRQARAGDQPLAVFDEADRNLFRASFGRTAFMMQHRLAQDPLFSLPRLAAAAARLIESGRGSRFTVRAGSHSVNTPYTHGSARPQSLSAFYDIETSDSFIKLGNISEVDEAYAAVSRAVVADTEAMLGHAILGGVTLVNMTVFIASPNVVTPYHIDHDANFLCQIAGEKDVYLFDANDRELLPLDEIEQFYFGNTDAARYREQFQPRGRCFHVAPGLGVHQPQLWPHWVRNGPNVSISVSIHICTRDLDRRAHVIQVNRILKKARLHPRPPDESMLLDSIKASGLHLIGTSHPESTAEVVYSGLDRLSSGVKKMRSVKTATREWVSRLGHGPRH
ncbi:MAG TPA: cupin-like domain-containing protein [Lysobacter sp.]